MTRLRRFLLSVTAFAGLVSLAACASIPTSGSVEQGSIEEEQESQGLRYYPSEPSEGASREEIVQGFIDAGTGMQNNFATARQYLTDEAADSWKPAEQVLITSGQVSMRTDSDNAITVTVPVTGTVDAHGNYEEVLSSSNETLDFQLSQVSGEWRISDVPDGIVLLRQSFTDLFQATSLTFFDSEQQYTVPDLRWFPNTDALADRVVEELLRGPSDWLYPGEAVTSAFPGSTTLISSVNVVEGQAIVNLSGDASAAASASDLSLMRLQLERSLTAIDEITSVELRVNGARIDASLPSGDTVTTSPQVNSLPLVFQDGSLGYLNSDTLSPPAGAENVNAVAGEIDPIRGALSASRQTVTMLTEDGTYAMRYDDTEATLIDSRGGQVEPALDNWDWVWTQSTTQTGLYVSKIGEGSIFEIPLPEGVAPDFISHQISRDGTRLAVLFEGDEGVTLAVMPIIRDGGEPMALGDPILVEMPGTDDVANDLAWVDSSSIAMLVDDGDGTTEVRLYRVGGELTSLGSIPNAIQVAGSNSLAGMRIVDRQGIVYSPRGTRWQASETVVNFLFAQE
ncbi:LpqB family beta-propeller domain-containing protein [Gulosibacter faecalis]|jgi:hypothetical protein|uniref:LpqB family beta-propeller domain-containing protein n=1 Tax=Gulosibacter faecalis TaxID=272240 RepID=A0ABW5UZL0_9MICO|nr:LpqB family beta-propeller domain-containing protein [Gulosibacter faecalis]